MGNQPKQYTHILFIPYTVLTDLKDTAWLLADTYRSVSKEPLIQFHFV